MKRGPTGSTNLMGLGEDREHVDSSVGNEMEYCFRPMVTSCGPEPSPRGRISVSYMFCRGEDAKIGARLQRIGMADRQGMGGRLLMTQR